MDTIFAFSSANILQIEHKPEKRGHFRFETFQNIEVAPPKSPASLHFVFVSFPGNLLASKLFLVKSIGFSSLRNVFLVSILCLRYSLRLSSGEVWVRGGGAFSFRTAEL